MNPDLKMHCWFRSDRFPHDDLQQSQVNARFGNVVIGERAAGALRIGANPDNHFVADSILMGVDGGSGVFEFGDGRLIVGSMEKGNGSATFTFTDGELTVDTFGNVANPWVLNNRALAK